MRGGRATCPPPSARLYCAISSIYRSGKARELTPINQLASPVAAPLAVFKRRGRGTPRLSLHVYSCDRPGDLRSALRSLLAARARLGFRRRRHDRRRVVLQSRH